jgi:6-phosphogluconolactonase
MQFEAFSDRESASRCAASRLAAAIRQGLFAASEPLVAVSGGTTPQVCLERLADASLPWESVSVTVTDERCVPADHTDSNERMVRARLFTGAAANATFLPLDEITDAKKFSAVLLGMGHDGHFASLFPDAEILSKALDLDSGVSWVAIETHASVHSRKSLTLARLLKIDSLILLIFGDEKRKIVESPDQLPVQKLLQQDRVLVQVLWAP